MLGSKGQPDCFSFFTSTEYFYDDSGRSPLAEAFNPSFFLPLADLNSLQRDDDDSASLLNDIAQQCLTTSSTTQYIIFKCQPKCGKMYTENCKKSDKLTYLVQMKEQVHQKCLEEELTSKFFIMLLEIQRDINGLYPFTY